MKTLEHGVRAMIANDSGPEGSALFDIHYAEFAAGYRESLVAALAAMDIPMGKPWTVIPSDD
jgi:hypothetical protein